MGRGILRGRLAAFQLAADVVMPTSTLEILQVFLGGHAGIVNKGAAIQLPAYQVILDLLDSFHIGRVIGEYPVLDRDNIPIDRQNGHHLRQDVNFTSFTP